MKQKEINLLLSAIYEDPIESTNAWKSYSSFVLLFDESDQDLTDYLLHVVELNRRQRLDFRNKIAERGYELTPNQLNQYILLVMIAMREYIDTI
tara:strand:+ start:219 stop:500 length:282 start_codon:yes stop_codon:yes gene_type:complete